MSLLHRLLRPLAEAKPAHLDAPEATLFHRQRILQKAFLRRIYTSWYAQLLGYTNRSGRVLELGSGGGFLKDMAPEVISSDVLPLPHCDLLCSAHALPFASAQLSGIVLLDVLHHLPQVRQFLAEADRCLAPGGTVVMIEPANTPFARWVYSRLHHEPFRPHELEWHFQSQGALSDANGALPWMVFVRDRAIFEQQFPQLRIERIRLHTPIRYLLSGGLSYRFPVPGWMHPLVLFVEWLLGPFNAYLAMFQTIVLRKQ